MRALLSVRARGYSPVQNFAAALGKSAIMPKARGPRVKKPPVPVLPSARCPRGGRAHGPRRAPGLDRSILSMDCWRSPRDLGVPIPEQGGCPMVTTTLCHRDQSRRRAARTRAAAATTARSTRGQGNRRLFCAAVLALSLTVLSLVPGAGMAAPAQHITFAMQTAQPTCLPYATGRVTISSLGPVENMHVEVEGLPPNTDFDFFVIQVPKAPFGLSWYQGDMETDDHGSGVGDFTGRFNRETFIVAPGPAPAPVLHHSPIADAATNPPTT